MVHCECKKYFLIITIFESFFFFRYYDMKKTAARKEQKTIEASEKVCCIYCGPRSTVLHLLSAIFLSTIS